MENAAHIAVVEDNPPQRMILQRLLESEYKVSLFPSGEEFLESSDTFAAVLLDIEMPGLSGYDTCRRFRERSVEKDIPVIFVSAHDTAPERVAAYEAGGDDFLTKPIAAHELRHKLSGIIEHRERLRELAQQSTNAQHVAFAAMTSMGDLGVVIEFMRKSALANSHSAVAARLIAAMNSWGLRGAVQVRSGSEQISLTADGPMSPMQTAVLETMRGMGRIFELGSRAVVNYERVSLLVENLPVDDPEKVGRLRDHLTVLAESADMRILALEAVVERDLQKVGIEATLAELKGVLQRIAVTAAQGRTDSQNHLLESLEHLGRTVETLGLTEIQTTYLDDLIRDALDQTRQYFDDAAHNESEFAEVLARLQRLANADYRL